MLLVYPVVRDIDAAFFVPKFAIQRPVGLHMPFSHPAGIAFQPFAEFDERFEKDISAAHFIDRVYTSLDTSLNTDLDAGPSPGPTR